MSEILLELCCEEIPAMMQAKAELAYFDIFKKYFQDKKINYDNLHIFIGPRRITIFADGLQDKLEPQFLSIKGPKINAPDMAIDGFCKTHKINKGQLIIKDVKGAECYFLEENIPEQKTTDVLFETLSEPLMSYVWPKSMYWSDHKIKWVRPILNILCLFDKEIIPFKFGHLTANNMSYGHRFMAKEGIKIVDFADYQQKLRDNFVILTRQERIDLIQRAMQKKAESLNLFIKDDPVLLEEVAGLAEFPNFMVGEIDKQFLKLPSEVLVTSMRSHQKYFSLFDKEGNFAPYFFFVSNMNPSDDNFIIKGNEKVLSARLSDALYFYKQDTQTTLVGKAQDLDKILFHAKLGSLKDKTNRLTKLVKFIDSNNQFAFEAAQICKSDILSEMVGEFPNLQGIIGYYYALDEGRDEKIARAICDHYKPQGPNDEVPSDEAAILAIADKIDSLCGLIIAGFKPTGSKDPYALRRMALGVIRILLENKISLNIISLVEFSCNLYKMVDNNSADYVGDIIAFIEDRAKNYFKDEFKQNHVEAVVNLVAEPDLITIKMKLVALDKFLANEDGNILLNSYRRANNIVSGKSFNGFVDKSLFQDDLEQELFNFLELNNQKLENAISAKDFLLALAILARIKPLIADFFDNIMVMDKNAKIANNRLLLLKETKKLFDKIVNFSLL